LYVHDVTSTLPREWVRAWKPGLPGISEVFHARFVRHAYPRHTHEDWTVFVVDQGGIRYDLGDRPRGVGPAIVTVLPPHVVHDGRPASDAGFHKRVLYVEPDVLGLHLIGRAADQPDIHDRSLLRAVHRLHAALEAPEDLLEAESMLAFVGEKIRAHLQDGPATQPSLPDGVIAGMLRDLLNEHLSERFTLTDAAEMIGASTARLIRAFTSTFGIAPHQYVIGRRIEHARKRLLAGEPAALTAVEVGFHDQAHLTRHFRRHVGETPARFASSGGRTGDQPD
jgi:AraC-like DNA-binding protein